MKSTSAPRRASSVQAIDPTESRFSYQWTHFDHLTPEFEKHFRTLVGPIQPSDFSGKLVLDAGCGYGRYALCAEHYGGRVIGMDFSDALSAAKPRVEGRAIRLVRGDILHPPFRPGSFDLVMSLGVLHHLEDPVRGFVSLSKCVGSGGSMVLWLYSAQRKLSNATIETLRRLARSIPNRWLRWLSFVLAIPDFVLSKVAGWVRPALGANLWARRIPTHFRLYARFPFRVCWADWFDRLGAPIRHYYTRAELADWLELTAAEGLISPTQDFGWTLVAQFPTSTSRKAGM